MRRILELGCGHGTHAEDLSLRGELVAVDLAPAMLSGVRERSPRGLYCAMNCEALGFPSQSFDEIHAYDVLEHVNELGSALAEAARVIRPEGLLIIEVPNHHSEAMLECLNPDYFRQSHHTRRLAPREWIAELNRHGVFVDRISRNKFLESFYLGYWFSRKRSVVNQQGELTRPEDLRLGDRVLEILLSLTLRPVNEVREAYPPEDISVTEECLGKSLETIGTLLEVWEEWGAQVFPKTIRLEGRMIGGEVKQDPSGVPVSGIRGREVSESVIENLEALILEQRKTVAAQGRELEAMRGENARMVEDIAHQQQVNRGQYQQLTELTAKVNRLVALVDERQRANEALAAELARSPLYHLRRWLRKKEG